MDAAFLLTHARTALSIVVRHARVSTGWREEKAWRAVGRLCSVRAGIDRAYAYAVSLLADDATRICRCRERLVLLASAAAEAEAAGDGERLARAARLSADTEVHLVEALRSLEETAILARDIDRDRIKASLAVSEAVSSLSMGAVRHACAKAEHAATPVLSAPVLSARA